MLIDSQTSLFCVNDVPEPWPVELSDSDVRRLGIAVFVQAIRDAASRDRTPKRAADREAAQTWLIEDGAAWARSLGMRINRADIVAWIDSGCPRLKVYGK